MKHQQTSVIVLCILCKFGFSLCDDTFGCTTVTTGCHDPGTTELCTGRGCCKCNRCHCNSTHLERYSGRYCEKCPTCTDIDRCIEIAKCVQCIVFRSGEYSDEEFCLKKCKAMRSEIEQVNVATADNNLGEKYCHQTDETDMCRFYYAYGYDRNGKIYIKAQTLKDCPPEPPIFLTGFGVVAGIVVGGIVLVGTAIFLIWKLKNK